MEIAAWIQIRPRRSESSPVTPFLDTNVLVYANSSDPRFNRAVEVLGEGGIVSTQVVIEFVNVMAGKSRKSWPEIESALHDVLALLDPVQVLTMDTLAHARELAAAEKINWFDALIVASALEAGCDTLYTEDFQNGRKFGKLKIVNPFV
jgi:predicted nucleic acid-binding protein